jgi:hypothetical protein
MADEEKELSQEAEKVEAPSSDKPTTQEPEASAAPEEATEKSPNALAEKRGRMVASGLIAAVVLSLIAVLVAGIFQFGSKFLAPCPADLPVNDPAPVLWKAMTDERVPQQSLGVGQSVSGQVKLKAPVAAAESTTDAATGQNK